MVNKIKEKRSISLVIREMLIKITRSYCYTFTRMAKIKDNRISNADRMESHWVSHSLLMRMKNVTTTVVNFLKFFINKANIHLILWSNNFTLRHMYKNRYINVHCSFIHNSKTLETNKCPSTGEWMTKM